MRKKKIAAVLLALTLAAVCFGCGRTGYTEVAEEHYATTIASFSSAVDKLENEESGGYKMSLKINYDEWITDLKAEIWLTETEEIVKLDTTTSAQGESFTTKIYILENILYAELPRESAESFGGKTKIKMSMDNSIAEYFTGSVEMIQQAFQGVLEMISSIKVATVEKLEVAGREGGSRRWRITVTEESIDSMFEIKIDKDNNLIEIKAITKANDQEYEMTATRIFVEPTLPDLTAFEDLPSMGA